MEVDAAAPTTPQKTPTEALPRATPALRGETSEAGNRPTGPAGHSKTVRIATSSLMNSKHAGADEPPSTQTSANERGRRERNKEAKEQRASPSAQIQEEKREGKKDGWTTVERKQRGGKTKQSRDRSPLYESWRPQWTVMWGDEDRPTQGRPRKR